MSSKLLSLLLSFLTVQLIICNDVKSSTTVTKVADIVGDIDVVEHDSVVEDVPTTTSKSLSAANSEVISSEIVLIAATAVTDSDLLPALSSEASANQKLPDDNKQEKSVVSDPASQILPSQESVPPDPVSQSAPAPSSSEQSAVRLSPEVPGASRLPPVTSQPPPVTSRIPVLVPERGLKKEEEKDKLESISSIVSATAAVPVSSSSATPIPPASAQTGNDVLTPADKATPGGQKDLEPEVKKVEPEVQKVEPVNVEAKAGEKVEDVKCNGAGDKSPIETEPETQVPPPTIAAKPTQQTDQVNKPAQDGQVPPAPSDVIEAVKPDDVTVKVSEQKTGEKTTESASKPVQVEPGKPVEGLVNTPDGKAVVDETKKPDDSGKGQGQPQGQGQEEPIVDHDHDDMPSFDEWKKKTLAEEEKKQTNGKYVHVSEPNALKTRPNTMRTNYASLSCGAKVLANNAEVQHAEYVLSDNKDQYMINPCAVEKKWFVLELCEPIQVKFIDIANFELFSSLPESFKIYTSDRYPSKDWKWLGIFYAKEDRKIQSFPIHGQQLYSKYVRVEMLTHYGTEHFCPISLLRIFGKSYADIDDDDAADSGTDDIPSPDVVGQRVAAEDQESGNLFTSATHLVINVMKKVLRVQDGDEVNKAGNVSAPNDAKNDTARPSHPTGQSDASSCNDVTKGQPIKPDVPQPTVIGDQAQASVSPSGVNVQPSTPTVLLTTPSILFTSFSQSRCYACYISQSNYRTYRSIIGPSKCVYLYTLHRIYARECSCRKCRKRKAELRNHAHSVITPPFVAEPTQQSPLVTELLSSDQSELTVTIATTDATTSTSTSAIVTTPVLKQEIANNVTSVLVESVTSSIETPPMPATTDSSQQQHTVGPDVAKPKPDTISVSIDANSVSIATKPEAVVDDKKPLEGEAVPVEEPSFFENSDSGLFDVKSEGLEFPDQSLENLPVGGPASAGKRESAIMRINNRLKSLEVNMSLSSRYLEQLSKRYKKQMEAMYKSFNKTIDKLTETSKVAAISEQRQQESISALRKQLGELGNNVAILQTTVDNMHIKYLETHLFWLLIETIIMVAIVTTCTRRGASPQQVQAMIDRIPDERRPRTATLTRRVSDSHLVSNTTNTPHKSLLKRSGSDSNLYIVEPSIPLLTERKTSSSDASKRKRKHKKSKRLLTAMGTGLPTRVTLETVAKDDLHIHSQQRYGAEMNRSLSLENIHTLSDPQDSTSSNSLSNEFRTSSNGHAGTTAFHRHKGAYARSVEFIGPLDFYETRGDKRKKKYASKENLSKDFAKRTTPTKNRHWSQPLAYFVPNGTFPFPSSSRISPRCLSPVTVQQNVGYSQQSFPQNIGYSQPNFLQNGAYSQQSFLQQNGGYTQRYEKSKRTTESSSDTFRLPRRGNNFDRLSKFESLSDSGKGPQKQGKIFPGKKPKIKGNHSDFMDQMER